MLLTETHLEIMPLESLYGLRDTINSEIQRRKQAIKLKKESKPKPSYIVHGLLDIPSKSNNNRYTQLHYLPSLLEQDWSSLFSSSHEGHDFYVYAHTLRSARANYPGILHGKLSGCPFYIGKGRGDRAFNLKRNGGHGEKIKDLIHDGVLKITIPNIILGGLTEAEALELEAKLIHFFGTIYAGMRGGQRKGKLLNIEYPKLPEFTGVMPPSKNALKDLSLLQKIDNASNNDEA